jgi:hypothetical protein
MAREWKPDFLAALTLSPNVTAACLEARITRKGAYLARTSDPEFAAAWDSALDESTDELVGEMYRRAVQGTKKPVYQGGELVGHIQEYSDTLAIFLAKCHRRDVYGDKVQTDLTSQGEKVQTVFYIPENGRDPMPGDPSAEGPPGNIPVD